MILLLIPVVSLVASIIVTCIGNAEILKLERVAYDRTNSYTSKECNSALYKKEKMEGIVSAMSWIRGFAICILVIMLFVLFCTRVDENRKLYRLQTRYELLTYQCENNMYNNDNELGKFELVNQIREYNEEVVSGRAGLKNPWINTFVPHIYNKLELIDEKTLDGLKG